MASTLPESGWGIMKDVLKHRNWDIRDGQRDMVTILDDCLKDVEGSQTIVAPTGTGKSLANLCAAIAAGSGIIYATSTKALQNQLRLTELPNLKRDMEQLYGMSLKYAILKGKDNYPCIHALSSMVQQGEGLIDANPETAIIKAMYEKVTTNIENGDFGNLDCEDELSQLSQETRLKLLSSKCHSVNSPWAVRSNMSSDDFLYSPESVLELDWKHGQACTYSYALAYAMLADIVVVNTALLVAEVSYNNSLGDNMSSGRGFILGRKTVIIDEAHHTSNIVASSMSAEVSFSKYAEAVGDLSSKFKKSSPPVYKAAVKLIEMLKVADGALRSLAPKKANEGDRDILYDLLMKLSDNLSDFRAVILEQIGEGNTTVLYGTSAFLDYIETEVFTNISPIISALHAKFPKTGDFSYNVSMNLDSDESNCTINSVPLDVSFFGKQLLGVMKVDSQRYSFSRRPHSHHVIACSATIQGNLHIVLGLPNSYHDSVPSPFDPKLSRLWVPKEGIVGSPSVSWRDEVGKKNRTDLMRKAIVDVITAAGGRTLILTTSTAAARDISEFLRTAIDYPVLSQFEGDRKSNMERFANEEETVFVGTVGYWEGVDIPGRALSAVIVDKILFPYPGDPVAEARKEYVDRRGGKSFQEVSVEHASVMIAQAFGRLTRSVEDAGLVAIFDPRICDSWYGSLILSKIDRGTPITRDKDVALQWLRDCVQGVADSNDVEGWNKIGKKSIKRGKRSAGTIKYNR